jgi:hypothetical protein
MEVGNVLGLIYRYGGGLAFLTAVLLVVVYFGRQLAQQGAQLGIASLQAALAQNEKDKDELRDETARQKAEVRKELDAMHREIEALKRHNRALQQYIIRNVPDHTDMPGFDSFHS